MHRLAYKHTQWPTLFREWFCSSEANRHEICTRLRHRLKIKVPRVSPERKLGKLHEGIMLIFVPEKIGHYFWWRVYQMSVISQHPLSVITGSSPRNKPESDVNLRDYKKAHSRRSNTWRRKTGWETTTIGPDNNSYLDIMYLSCVIVAVAGKNRHTVLTRYIYVHIYIYYG